MSMNKKHLVAALVTLALLMASSYRATADCKSRTGIRFSSDKMCVTLCLQKNCGFIGGYCSRLRCICTRDRTVVLGEPGDGEGDAGLGGGGMPTN